MGARRWSTVLAILWMLVACTCCAALAPACAWAAPTQEKHAIPTLAKAVSADGADYAERLKVDAGSRVRYRISFTMPEDIASREEFDCTVLDKPDGGISLDLRTARARVLDARGVKKAHLAATADMEEGIAAFKFGNLKEACPGLAFGDTVVLDVAAAISGDTAGELPNVAWLRYVMDGTPQQTEKAMALVRIPPSPSVPAAQKAGALPQTGDASHRDVAAAAVLAACLAAVGWRRRRAH